MVGATLFTLVTGVANAAQLGQSQRVPPEELLRSAIAGKNLDGVKLALMQGANPNSYLASGDTPLTLAFRADAPSIVDYLLSNPRVNSNLENRMGESPLMLAIIKKDHDRADALLKRGASPLKNLGWSPLHYAATIADVPMMEKLVKLGANVNAQTPAGVTPLMMAARRPNREAVTFLLKHGAYRDVCTKDGMSPAQFADNAGDVKLAEYLKIDHCAVKGLIDPSIMDEKPIVTIEK